MLSEKDLIYFGTILLFQSGCIRGTVDNCITTAKQIYDKIFKEDE